LIGSAKLNGLDPEAYLREVLTSGVTSKAANGGHFKTGQRNVAWD